ncbi:ROK family protein [Roseibium aggregatum]|jgi:glucokinase|uniref:ROK family protein n=1 Tax=Roseibium TaxID=150830 RepID=UPI001E513B96|nr:ROK family protein [Roseibium aggregatum]MCR9281819.1 ROK family protein [Paracoccaceae bacterium]MEC9418994.1 ROK family protein [Pseudomonadota bacterium]UES56127.1 ROK family protein [Roseibium aggregatum]WJS02374.1 ROK family protein [Roseibium aggregatum]
MSFSKNTKSFAYPVLVADIGGTNARFALVDDAEAPTRMCGKTATADHPDISSAIREVVLPETDPKPRTAIIAVAGPVTGDRIPLTNAAWVIEPLKMIADLGLDEVIVLNDFEAQALALPGYSGSDIEQVGSGTIREESAKFVLGPGTGLGAAAMIYAAQTWVPVPGEGGHVELGPVTPEDVAIWPHIELVGGRLGAEQILSGTGLPRLARGVAAYMGADRDFTTAASITTAAEANDPVAVKTLEVFARALGRVAGDFALAVLARGGVYLTGGVTSRITRFLTDGGFRAAFEAKAPHEALMAKIPTFIVRHPDPALEGLASFARAPEAFAVDMQGRQWTAGAASGAS